MTGLSRNKTMFKFQRKWKEKIERKDKINGQDVSEIQRFRNLGFTIHNEGRLLKTLYMEIHWDS